MQPSSAQIEGTQARKGKSLFRLPRALRSVESMQILGLTLVIVLISVLMQMNYPYFLTPLNIEILTVNFITEAIIALGMTIVIVTGGIDLSVAAVLPFTAIVVGKLMIGGVPVPLAIVITLGLAAGVGILNATMFLRFRVHPFIATLATLLTLRGFNLVMTDGGSTVSGFPNDFKAIGQGRTLDIPTPLLIFAVLAVIIGWSLKNQKYLRQAYFIGGNPRAARMSGINVNRFLTMTYMLCAFLAGLAGIVTASQFGAASNSYGQNMELRVITSVVIGGASLFGGTGSILGTTLGVLFLAIIYNAFAMTGVSTYWQDVVIGVMLLVAVFLSESLKKQRMGK